MRHREKKRSFGDVSAASMSDIAFLLLIFFLVTTIFALEEGIPILLPPKEAPKAKVKRENLLTVQAHANGAITLDDKFVALSQVRSAVERRLATNEELIVVLETHPDSEYGLMVDLLDELRLANARRISLKQMARANVKL